MLTITNSECMCIALATQQAQRMRRITLSSVACPALPYFPTLPQNRQVFRGGWWWLLEHKMCVSIFSANFVRKLLIPRRIQRHTVTNVQRSSCTVPVFMYGTVLTCTVPVFMHGTGLHVRYRSYMHGTGLHARYRSSCTVPVFVVRL
jgi:hypothetical protein